MSRMNQWFVVGDGIAREVITADIQRYLGPDALVRPGVGTGEYEGRPGYWITAYRTLTTQMIQDLKLDSQRWQQEKDRDQRGRGEGVAYQDSRTHASRQHYGPTEGGYASAPAKAPQAAYATSYASSSDPHYTTAPQAAYGAPQQAYQSAPPSHAAPRTDPSGYANYPQSRGDYQSYPTPAQGYPSYAQPAQVDQYGRPIAPSQQPYQPSTTQAAPGYYIASDGRQYPLAQQPQQRGGQRRGG